jgi:glycerophosphoryl diester phosphodiesterase
VPLVQLVDSESAPNDFLRTGDGRTFADLIQPAGLREVSTYAQVLAPHKDLVIPRRPDGSLDEPTRLVDQAHRSGLAVQLWTFRAERRFVPTNTDFPAELRAFARLGIQALFTDHPDQAVAAVRKTALNV